MSQQAFSKAREKFDHSPFVKMFDALVYEEYSGRHKLPTLYGYHILSADGSHFQLPREDALREEFGANIGNCPQVGVSTLFDVLNGWVLHATMTHRDMNERHQLLQHIEYFCAEFPHIAQKTIVMLDRGYPSLEVIKKFDELGLKYIIRCPSVFLKEINNAPLGNSDFEYTAGKFIRVIKHPITEDGIQILITNVFDLSKNKIKKLYPYRWKNETLYHTLKKKLCVETFTGRTVNSVKQDFWASMVMINTVAVFQNNADKLIKKRHKNKNNIHTYKANTADLIVTMRDKLIFTILLTEPSEIKPIEIENILRDMSNSISPIRNGRHEDRKFRPSNVTNHQLKSHL